MLSTKDKAATSAKATAHKNIRQIQTYQTCAAKSTENLKEQIGLLLCHLHSPLNQRQRAMGWKLLEALLSARYAEGVE